MAQSARKSAATQSVAQRIDGLDWMAAEQSLSERGYAVTAPVLSPEECASLSALYNDASRFRSHIIMERYRFGIGDYKYFANRCRNWSQRSGAALIRISQMSPIIGRKRSVKRVCDIHASMRLF